jgi:hypothetical protein
MVRNPNAQHTKKRVASERTKAICCVGVARRALGVSARSVRRVDYGFSKENQRVSMVY